MSADPATSDPWRREGDRLILTLRLTPRADRSRLDGVRIEADGRAVLAIRVEAPPVEGAANAALIAFLAKRWKIPRSAFDLIAGETARVKRLSVTATPERLIAIETDLVQNRTAS